jgi:hypothetical protein
MTKRDEVLAPLKDGPVLFRNLAHGRRAAFRLVYAQLLHEGLIQESGMGTRQDPKYVGLPGAEFPPRRVSVRHADLRLLMRSGMTEADAREALSIAGAKGEGDVYRVCQEAHDRILDRGVGLTFAHQPEGTFKVSLPPDDM